MGKARREPLEDPHKKHYPSPGDYIIPGFSDLILKKYSTEMSPNKNSKNKNIGNMNVNTSVSANVNSNMNANMNFNESVKENSSKMTSEEN